MILEGKNGLSQKEQAPSCLISATGRFRLRNKIEVQNFPDHLELNTV